MVIPGSSSTFTVTVKIIPGHEHTYQWQKNKTNISEATSSTLTISGVTRSDDEATYCCIVSNAAGSVTSDPAEITVCKLNNAIVLSLLTTFKFLNCCTCAISSYVSSTAILTLLAFVADPDNQETN